MCLEDSMNPVSEAVFLEIHSGNLREGPGDFESTKRAFLAMNGLPKAPEILDVGCGPGQQTLDLLELSDHVRITAVDLYPQYLHQLEERVKSNGHAQRVSLLEMDMEKMNFDRQSYDAIWAEGSAYIIGVPEALRVWKRFLKPGGYLAFTELCWFSEERPTAIDDYLSRLYPPIKNVGQNLALIDAAGYQNIISFALPKEAWIQNYYEPIMTRLPAIREKYRDDEPALRVVESEEEEIRMYKVYSDYYGYEFFVCRL